MEFHKIRVLGKNSFPKEFHKKVLGSSIHLLVCHKFQQKVLGSSNFRLVCHRYPQVLGRYRHPLENNIPRMATDRNKELGKKELCNSDQTAYDKLA